MAETVASRSGDVNPVMGIDGSTTGVKGGSLTMVSDMGDTGGFLAVPAGGVEVPGIGDGGSFTIISDAAGPTRGHSGVVASNSGTTTSGDTESAVLYWQRLSPERTGRACESGGRR